MTHSDPTGPVIAYRRWRVNRAGELTGLMMDNAWPPGRQVARCHGRQPVTTVEACGSPGGPWDTRQFSMTFTGPPRDVLPTSDGRWVRLVERRTCTDPIDVPVVHPTPSLRAMCGLWAHKQPIPDCRCPSPTADRHGVVGVVRLTGRAVEGEDGWLAEHADVVAVVDHSGRLAPEYDMPRYPDTASMWAEWAPDQHGWSFYHDPFWCGGHDRVNGLGLTTMMQLVLNSSSVYSTSSLPPVPDPTPPTVNDAIKQATTPAEIRNSRNRNRFLP